MCGRRRDEGALRPRDAVCSVLVYCVRTFGSCMQSHGERVASMSIRCTRGQRVAGSPFAVTADERALLLRTKRVLPVPFGPVTQEIAQGRCLVHRSDLLARGDLRRNWQRWSSFSTSCYALSCPESERRQHAQRVTWIVIVHQSGLRPISRRILYADSHHVLSLAA